MPPTSTMSSGRSELRKRAISGLARTSRGGGRTTRTGSRSCPLAPRPSSSSAPSRCAAPQPPIAAPAGSISATSYSRCRGGIASRSSSTGPAGRCTPRSGACQRGPASSPLVTPRPRASWVRRLGPGQGCAPGDPCDGGDGVMVDHAAANRLEVARSLTVLWTTPAVTVPGDGPHPRRSTETLSDRNRPGRAWQVSVELGREAGTWVRGGEVRRRAAIGSSPCLSETLPGSSRPSPSWRWW